MKSIVPSLIVLFLLLSYATTSTASFTKDINSSEILFKDSSSIYALISSDRDSIAFNEANEEIRQALLQQWTNAYIDSSKYIEALECQYHILYEINKLRKEEDNINTRLKIAEIYELIPQLNFAEEQYLSTLKLTTGKDSSLKSKIYYNLAKLKHRQRIYKDANHYFNLSKAYLSSKTTKHEQANQLQFHAILLHYAQEYDEALQLLDSAIAIDQQGNNTLGIAINMNSKARIYSSLKDYNTALELYKKAFDIELKHGNKYPVIKAINLASAYHAASKYELSLKTYNALKDHLPRNSSRIMSTYYYNLSVLHKELFHNKQSSLYADSAIVELVKAKDYDRAIQLKTMLLKEAITNEEWTKVCDYYSFIVMHKDSLFEYDASVEIRKTQLSNKLKALQYKFENQQEKTALQLKQVSQQLSSYRLGFYLLLLILVISIGFLIYAFRTKQKHNQLHEARFLKLQMKADSLKEDLEQCRSRSQKLNQELNRFIHLVQKSRDVLKELLSNIKNKKEHDNIVNELRALLEIHQENSVVRFNLDADYLKLASQIKQSFPDLNSNEEKFCLLMKLNFSMKEIGNYMNISPRSAEVARYRLRKKLKFESNEELIEALEKI